MKINFMNTWTYEKDFYLLPLLKFSYLDKEVSFMFAFLCFCVYNTYTQEKDYLEEYYDQFK